MRQWLEDQFVGRESSASPPVDGPHDTPQLVAPLCHSCIILVNPFYRWIYVRNPKTASTSVFKKTGGWCKEKLSTKPKVRRRGPVLQLHALLRWRAVLRPTCTRLAVVACSS